MRQWTMRAATALALMAVLAASAHAAPVFGTSADLTGSRSTGDPGLIAGGSWSGVTVSWLIEATTGGFNYTYSFGGTNSPGLSHFVLSLSPDCTIACTNPSDEFGTWGPGPSNPGFPAGFSIFGAKFNTSDEDAVFEFTFFSERVPVWGDIYGKGGSSSFFYNTGLTDHLSENVLDFIARPDTQTAEDSGGSAEDSGGSAEDSGGSAEDSGGSAEDTGGQVPGPATVALLGLGLLGIAALRRSRR